MATRTKTKQTLVIEIEDLRARLAQAETALLNYKTSEAEAQLAENAPSQSFWRAGNIHSILLAQVSDAVIAVDNDQRVTYLNAAAEQQYGVNASEAIGCRLDDLYRFQWLTPEDESTAFTKLRDEGMWRGQNIHVCRDGKVLRVESSVSLLTDDAGAPIGMLAVIRDVTRQQEAEALMRRSESRLRHVLDNLFAFVGVMLPDGTLIEANRAPLEAAGIALEDVIGKKFWDCFWWNHSPEVQAQLRDAVDRANRGEVVRYDVPVRMAGDSRMWIDFQLAPLRDDDGRITHLIPSAMDITSRQLTEEQIRRSEQRLRLALEAAQAGTFDMDVVSDALPIVTEGTLKLFGFPTNIQPKTRDFIARVHPEDRARVVSTIEQSVQQNTGHFVEYRIVQPDGKVVWVTSRAEIIIGNTQRSRRLIGAIIDITERKLAEAQVQASSRQIKQTNALLEAVLASAPVGLAIYDNELRYLRINEALARLNGQPVDAHVGHTNVEVIGPERADIIDPILRQVLHTGQTMPSIELSGPDGHFLSDIYPIQSADDTTLGVGVTVTDITERKRREAHAAFLSEMSDVLGRLSNPDEIMHATGEKISKYLNASRVFFIEIDQANELSIVLYDWCKDELPSTVGRYHISEYSDESFLSTLAAGNCFVINDTATDARLAPEAAAKFGVLQIGAALNTPYISNGQLRYVLAVQQCMAYQWRQDEIELMRDLTARLWPALERTRAEAALRKSEDRFRLASQAVQSVIYDWDMASDRVSRSQELVNLLGFSNDDEGVANNQWFVSRVHPEDKARALAILKRAIDNGADRFEDEMRLQHKDGHYIWARDCGVFLRDDAGKAVRCVGSITDITARKQAETALREGEARLSMALESGRMGAWEWDFASGIEYWTPEQEKLFGQLPGRGIYPAEQFFNQVHPEDRERIVSESEQASALGQDFIEDEFRIIRPDGSMAWIASRSRVHRDAQGLAVRMSGVNMDVTERKQAEEALRESELRFRRLSDANIIGIVTASLDAVITSNDEFLRMIGCSQEDVAFKRIDWQAMTPAEYIALDQKGLAQLMDQGWSDPYEKEFIRKDGTRVPVLVGGALLTREPLTWICFVVDLSERKRIEADLQAANYRFSIAEEAANSFSYAWDLEAGVIERSAGLQRVLGYAPGELAGTYEAWADLVHPDDKPPVTREQAVHTLRQITQEAFGFEYRARHKNGQYRWLYERGVVLCNANGEVHQVIGQAVDVTERKEAEEALRASESRYRELSATLEARVAERTLELAESREQLRELSAYVVRMREEERARIAREVHDELGGSLTVLKMSLARAARGHEEEAELITNFRDMRVQTDNLVKMVRRIASDLRPSILDDFGLIPALEWQAQEWSQRIGIPCRLDSSMVAEGLDLDAERRTAVFRVFQESLTNIARHARASHVSATLLEDDGVLELVVKDDGQGIDPARLKGGKSLGLLGMRERIREVGGNFEIDSAPGRGTAICVRVPLKKN